MTRPFDSYIILARMRTGSNLLEQTLNTVPGLVCHGEAFNPGFVGAADAEELLGVTLAQREADPLRLIARMKEAAPGLPGFRFFHDHDGRVLPHCLSDRRCAKIVLTRNPLECYISLKIAGLTGRWKMGSLRGHSTALAPFDAIEFEDYLATQQAFQMEILRALQTTAQTAFYIDYDDLHDLEVLNGLLRFLGIDHQITAVPDKIKKQNPEAPADKVANPAEMEQALARLDRFNLSRTPSFEPRRGPAVPGLLAAAGAPLMFMPLRAGPEAQLAAWLARAGRGGLIEGFTHKELRQWRRANPGHRSFAVLRHPVARAHEAFAEVLHSGGKPLDLRRLMLRVYNLALPQSADDPSWNLAAHRAGFLNFLRFLRGNLTGQTSVRVDPRWATQSALLQGYGAINGPDVVLREDRLAEGLAFVAAEAGIAAPPLPPPDPERAPYPLAQVYTPDIEAAAREAYQRDYLAFGFGNWQG